MTNMKAQPKIQGASVVLRGEFIPAIFHPAWLAAHELIRQEEAEAANVQLVHRRAAIFSTEWLQFRVLEDNFQVSTTQEPYYEALRDLVVGVFTLLKHTPLRAMGINRDFHYATGSEEAWHVVGHRLAPKEIWEDLLSKPGMISLTLQGERQDDHDGYIRVKVEPSTRAEFGVYIEVNDHYQLRSDQGPSDDTKDAITILWKNWNAATARARQIATTIVALAEDNK